jgi:hypothetical protein
MGGGIFTRGSNAGGVTRRGVSTASLKVFLGSSVMIVIDGGFSEVTGKAGSTRSNR